MSIFGGGGKSAKPPPVPNPVPVERAVEDIDESGRLEAERIRNMRGRLSTFMTRGIDLGPGSSVGTNKLGT